MIQLYISIKQAYPLLICYSFGNLFPSEFSPSVPARLLKMILSRHQIPFCRPMMRRLTQKEWER